MSKVQTFQLSYDDGARAVELARESVLSYVRHGQREQPGSMRDSFYNRTGAVVERVPHAPRLLPLPVSDVRQHRFPCQLDGSGTIIIRELERLNLRHMLSRRQSDLNMSLVGA